ncbi:FkbM family methyltransferase [Oxalobacter aliiformigenes]|uniref:FkbM family methyltransferase n=1 Tax=Oxalobacter aliiformigenes TaxID=2946593 RepID=UPI0022AF735B|nr:FkbM family methyltransferase [Oxalobacter aliiformigenes]WAV99782.1 FkbM family methyltransferase [Oxalobacter aliiformigenes]
MKITLNNLYMPPEQDDKYSWDGRRFEYLHRLLEIKDIKDVGFVRIGHEYDGGYIMLDDFHENMIAYSYGISNDVSWDLDMANHHIHCYMYDHTITSLPQESLYFHWRKEGICGIKKTDHCNTLDSHINHNGHASNKNLILKMDVEGAEWDALINLDEKTLNQFQQMVFEFHDMYDPHRYSMICRVLEKLNKTHQCIHVHGNNYGPRKCSNKLVIPHALEVLYARKESYEFLPSQHFYPREFDMPCNPYADEIILGYWNL